MILHKNTEKVALLFCALFSGCGDDGTERLSTCPDLRIETDQMGVIRCAGPKKPSAGDRADSTAKPDGSSGRQGTASNANRAAPGDSASGGNAAKPAAGASATAGKPAADSGEAAPAASGGGMPAPSAAPANAPSGGGWYCVQVMNACSCVMGGTVASDTCDKPRPTCCVTVKNDSSVNACVCYPEGSTECMGVKQSPSTYPPVSECPPK
jgi:hypothetical protein